MREKEEEIEIAQWEEAPARTPSPLHVALRSPTIEFSLSLSVSLSKVLIQQPVPHTDRT